MKKTDLRKFAQLVAKCGLNVQKGQEVWITTEFDQPEFVQMVAEECYKLGAKFVRIKWTYQPMTKVAYKYMDIEDLKVISPYREAELKYQAEQIPCRLFIESEDPDGLKGIDQKKMAEASMAIYPIIKKYRDQWENKDQWCIVAVPGVKWAKKLFPELSKKQAVDKLWEAIFQATRITDDPIKTWDEHNKDIQFRCDYLTKLNIQELEYKSSNGTDFRVGMIPQARFCGGGETSLRGIFFNPNMPTEECFISPMKGQAEGIVYATKPLSYQGQLIEDFWIRFKDGKAVEWDAKKNKDLLTKMLGMDEGASYLGECALVPFDSPINNSGILFYNTLFDENACCHLALGFGFADCIKDFEKYTLEECRKMGVNDSMIHTDFMIGSADLSIVAKCADGKSVQIFKDGNWAF